MGFPKGSAFSQNTNSLFLLHCMTYVKYLLFNLQRFGNDLQFVVSCTNIGYPMQIGTRSCSRRVESGGHFHGRQSRQSHPSKRSFPLKRPLVERRTNILPSKAKLYLDNSICQFYICQQTCLWRVARLDGNVEGVPGPSFGK